MVTESNIHEPERTCIKKYISENLDMFIFVSCIIGFIIEIFTPRLAVWIEAILGITGVIYCTYYTILCFRPIKRDWLLAKGKFLFKVVNYVLLVPFIIASFFAVTSLMTGKGYSGKDLFYEEDLYTENEYIYTQGFASHAQSCDSVFITAQGFALTNDSIVTRKSKLPASNAKEHKEPSLFWSIYYNFIDMGNQHMAYSEDGRKITAMIAILGFLLLNGLLISTLISWFDRRREQWLNGSIRYKARQLGKNRHAVVIGSNEIAASVIKNLSTTRKDGELNYKCEGNNRYIILQTNRNAEEVRDELASHLPEETLKKLIIYKALRDSRKELKDLYLENATEIYILGESTLTNSSETYHDAMNMRCVNLIAKELEKRGKHVTGKTINGGSFKKICKVLFEYQTTSSVFLFSDISQSIMDNLVFIPFSRYESWAKAVISDNTAIEDCNDENGNKISYTPLDRHDGISEDEDTHVHFVIVGMSKMGVAMGIQAMLQAHYINFGKAEAETDAEKRRNLKDKRRTRITFIDSNADKEMAFFKGRYENLFNLTRNRYIDANSCDEDCLKGDSKKGWTDPMLDNNGKWAHLSNDGENFIDIEIEFIKGSVESDGVRGYLRNISDRKNEWVKSSNLTIAVCLPQTHKAVAASLYMPVAVYEAAQEIWVYQRESADIILNLTQTERKDKRYKKLKPFGMLYGEYMNDRSQYLKAILVNGAYNLAEGTDNENDENKIKADKIDMSRKETYPSLRYSWKGLSLDKRFSNRYFVDSISQKIRSIKAVGLSSEEVKDAVLRHKEVLARNEHNRWNVQQLLLGYSPCTKESNDEFIPLNTTLYAAATALEKWKKEIGWNKLTNEEQKELETSEQICVDFEDARLELRGKKKLYKEGEDRMHPNICAYDHLDNIDYGAKDYDIRLNNIIHLTQSLVDDRIEKERQKTTRRDE